MDSLSSAPGNRNSKNRLLSAVFAIAASVSGSVNAATTPNFTGEPAGSEKLVRIMSAQQAILDMLPANHQSRQSILDAKKGLENGGDIGEMTKVYNWAQAIISSPVAPPAAKKEAESILTEFFLASNQENSETADNLNTDNDQQEIKLPENKTQLPPINETPSEKKTRIEKEKLLERINKALTQKESWSIDKSKGGDAKITSKDKKIIIEFSKGRNKDTITPEGIANCFIQLTPGDYIITLDSSGPSPIIYMYDSTGGRIDQTGKPAKDRIILKGGINNLSVPPNCGKLLISVGVDGITNPTAEIRSIKITSGNNT